MAASPTQRTLKVLRDMGAFAEKVEHWNHFAKRRTDLFGIIDILAIVNGKTVGIQATTGDNMSSRVTKIRESEALEILLDAEWNIEVWGWRKAGRRWIFRIVELKERPHGEADPDRNSGARLPVGADDSAEAGGRGGTQP